MKVQLEQIGDDYCVSVKRWYSTKQYIDLKSNNFTWSISSRFFKDCLTNSKEVAEKLYNRLTIKAKVIKSVKI